MRAYAPPAKSTKPKRTSPVRIQPKPAVGRIDDPLEQHADAVADQVMRMASAPATNATDAASGGSGDASSGNAARPSQTAPAASPNAADPAIGFADVALAAPGRPLDASTRSYFDRRASGPISAMSGCIPTTRRSVRPPASARAPTRMALTSSMRQASDRARTG